MLPGVENLTTAAPSQTCESSASTVPPPPFLQNSEGTSDDRLEIPPVNLLSSVPTVREDALSHQNTSNPVAASLQTATVGDSATDHVICVVNNKPEKGKRSQATNSRIEDHNKTEKEKASQAKQSSPANLPSCVPTVFEDPLSRQNASNAVPVSSQTATLHVLAREHNKPEKKRVPQATKSRAKQSAPVSLLSSGPIVRKVPLSNQNASNAAPASSQVTTANDLANGRNKTEKEKASDSLATKSRAEQSVGKVQKRKRRASPQPRKIKQPRLGPNKASVKKRGKPNARKNQTAKGKQATPKSATAVPNSLTKENENVKVTGKKAGPRVSKGNTNDAALSQEKATGLKESGKISRQLCDNPTKPSARTAELNCKQTDEKATKQFCDSKPCQETEVPAQKGEQPTSCEHDRKPEERKEGAIKDCETTELGTCRKDGETDELKKDKTDCTNKMNPEKKDEVTLNQKYEDLWRKYIGLVIGILQLSTPGVEKNGDTQTEATGDESARKSAIIDGQVYDTIYLCKTAGMLGSVEMGGGPSKYIRSCNRLEGFENPYKRIIADGFKFIEDLMMVGPPDESSSSSVRSVFRDLHLRLLTELWGRNHTKQGGHIVVGQTAKMMGDQLKQWYLKMIEGKINLRWSGLISEEFAEPLYRKLKSMDEELGAVVAATLRSVLIEISKQYQEAEKDISKASLEMFCNSCEVSICVARSVAEAALSLEEEDAFAIGRHNGVFSHCVSRLQAERNAEEDSGG